MTETSGPSADVDARPWRRFWPELVLLVGMVLFLLAIPVAVYSSKKLVLVGSFNGILIAGCLVISSVWCVALSLVGRVTKSVIGRAAGVLAILFQVPVFLGAVVLTGIIGLVAALLGDTGPRYFLDVPGTSSRYLVTSFTFGETSLTLYRGNGTVDEDLGLHPPFVDRSVSFASSHRVETDARGRSFLVYPKEGGGDARVLLPLTGCAE